MSVFTYLRSKFRSRHQISRRRKSIATIADVMNLEPRVLLSATSLQQIPDVSLTTTSDPQTIALGDFFDDPAISGSTVQIQTPLGSFVVETFDDVTPVTAKNFLDLVSGNNYADMFIHRSSPGFVIQGGGFNYPVDAQQPGSVDHFGTITNEFSNWFDPQFGNQEAGTPINTRGTVAMAKLGSDPNSATSQWFVNLGDNSGNLDNQNEGFTVFAKVLYDGMDVVDAIGALPTVPATAPFGELPVRDYTSGNVFRENLVTTATSVVDELTYEVSSSNPAVATVSIVDGELQVSGIQTGSTRLTVTATDLNSGTVSNVFEIAVDVPLTSKPTTAGAQTSRPTITWDAATNATHHELWINQIGGQNAIVHKVGLTDSSFSVVEDLPGGSYRYWIRSSNAAGVGLWSAGQDFTVAIAGVTITAPATRVVDSRRPVIEWTASEGATEYDLWVNHVGVQSQVIRETVSATSFTPSTDLVDGKYRAWVKARNANGESEWSDGVTFEVRDTINIIAPVAPSTQPRPTISWTGDSSQTFELWVNKVGGPPKVVHETEVSGTQFTPSFDLNDGSYRAWVRQTPAGQAPGPWSGGHDFTVAAGPAVGRPEISEVSGIDTAKPTFSWAAVENAVRYELWVNNVDGSAVRVIHDASISGLEFSVDAAMSSGNYRAWLRAFSATDTNGEWSPATDFVIS